MTPEDALEYLDSILREVPLPRAEHKRVEESIRVLGDELGRGNVKEDRSLDGLIQ